MLTSSLCQNQSQTLDTGYTTQTSDHACTMTPNCFAMLCWGARWSAFLLEAVRQALRCTPGPLAHDLDLRHE